jgi:hypothetical protein
LKRFGPILNKYTFFLLRALLGVQSRKREIAGLNRLSFKNVFFLFSFMLRFVLIEEARIFRSKCFGPIFKKHFFLLGLALRV